MALFSGRLREKITIERAERTRTDSGGYENSYDTVLETFASVEETEPSADVIASQEDTDNLVEFKIRYRSEINLKTGDNINWRDFDFTLNRFIVDPLRRWIEITATANIEETQR